MLKIGLWGERICTKIVTLNKFIQNTMSIRNFLAAVTDSVFVLLLSSKNLSTPLPRT